jgi:hypothetical protein
VRFALDVGEIRLKYRRLGFRLRRIKAAGAVRIPRRAVEAILRQLQIELLTVIPGQGIVIVDLSAWIPPDVTLSVIAVQATSRSLHVWLGPGELMDVPGSGRPALPSG